MESTALGQAVVLDPQGIVQMPNRPYAVVEEQMNKIPAPLSKEQGQGWRTVQEMTASIKRNAPGTPDEMGYPRGAGLPDGSPNPNTVYDKDGQFVRYVIDTSEPTERYVSGGQVRERIKFVPRLVSLTLEGARAATAAGNRCDYWNGFTWIRNGHIPERDFPTMVKQQAASVDGAELVFEQSVSPNDEAVIRHQIAHLERTRPTLPVEVAGTIAGDVTASQSVPFPEAASITSDGDLPSSDFTPSAEGQKRGPGRPPKVEA